MRDQFSRRCRHFLQQCSDSAVHELSLWLLQGFDCRELLYHDYKPLPKDTEEKIGCRYVKDVGDMVRSAPSGVEEYSVLREVLCRASRHLPAATEKGEIRWPLPEAAL